MSHSPTNSPAEVHSLEEAFSVFNRVSAELIESYEQLQQRAAELTAELARANLELERKAAENQDLLARLSLLLELLPAGVIEIDAQGQILRLNPAARELFGEALTQTTWAAYQPYFTPTPVEDRFVFCRGEADIRQLDIRQRPLPEDAGQIVLIQDVTRHHNLQERIEQQQRLVAMGQMAASLAHQLRTPLSTAMLYAGHLRREGLTKEEQQRFADKVSERLRVLEGLVQDMLRFVRGGPSQVEAVSANRFLTETVRSLQPQLQSRGLELDLQLLPQDVVIQIDSRALGGAVLNVLENAMHFASPASQIRVQAEREGNQLTITISNQGPIIPDALAERIFEPFFTTRSEGTGLGLAIVRRVLTEAGGEICLLPTRDDRCRFRLSLPCHD